MNSTAKQVLTYMLMLAVLICLWQLIGKKVASPRETTITQTDLIDQANEGKIAEVTVGPGSSTTLEKLTGKYKDGSRFNATISVNSPNILKTLSDNGVKVYAEDQNSLFWPIMFQYLPFMLVFGIFGLISLIAFWQIFRKAGFPAQLSLLMLVPFVNIAMLFFLAFSTWKVAPITSSSSNEAR